MPYCCVAHADCVWLLHEGMGAFCSCVTYAYAADCVMSFMSELVMACLAPGHM